MLFQAYRNGTGSRRLTAFFFATLLCFGDELINVLADDNKASLKRRIPDLQNQQSILDARVREAQAFREELLQTAEEQGFTTRRELSSLGKTMFYTRLKIRHSKFCQAHHPADVDAMAVLLVSDLAAPGYLRFHLLITDVMYECLLKLPLRKTRNDPCRWPSERILIFIG